MAHSQKKTDTRENEGQPLNRGKRLQKSSCEDTSLQEAQCRQPEPKKRKLEQANPYTSNLEGSSQLSKGRPELSVSVNDLYPDQKLQQSDPDTYNPVAHWTRTFYWPKDLGQRGLGMSETLSSKRKSESPHRAQTLNRMATHGVLMETSILLRKDSIALCEKYLEGSRKTFESSIFTAEQFLKVLERVQILNEARIKRDVTPWVLPSPETLFLRGKLKIGYIGEELDALWSKCATMGSTMPKPDFTGGLLPTAFTEEEISKLENYAQPTKPFHFTPNLSFPFLVGEAKTGEEGWNKAHRQNTHSASIAVRAIIMLYREAFGHESDRVLQLYGEVLVFSVSHDNDSIRIHGHFAVAEPDSLPEGLKYYCYRIVTLSFTGSGADMHKAYNFVMNVYEDFAPLHRKRIKDAVEKLPRPSEKTGLSFATSDISLNKADSQQDSQKGNSAVRKPSEPASSSDKKLMTTVRERMERQKKEYDQNIERERREKTELKEQLKQDREQSKQDREERKRDREQIERLLASLDQERERNEWLSGRLMDMLEPRIS